MDILSSLAQKLKCPESDLIHLILNAPYKYRVYTIPKRKHGRRTIAQPTKDLKNLQRAFLELHPFPFHVNSLAYRKGFSIKDNANCHKANSFFLKMDLANFFNSLDPGLFWSVWEKHWPLLHPLHRRYVENIIFWNNDGNLMLSVGAPSSPTISNFCMYFFDTKISEYCTNNKIVYTRYADDLTFSTNIPNLLSMIPSIISHLLKDNFGNKVLINYQKTVYSSKAHNRHVTGITITNDDKISIGREKKRYIKHLVNQFKYDLLDVETLQHLKGLISFANHIEPDFILSLRNKYSSDLIDEIVKAVL